MLLQCPECDLQVSDKATYCPHCGYPMQPNVSQRRPRKSNKRRRLPNGFGQISEIKGRNLSSHDNGWKDTDRTTNLQTA